jgi:hypothetical protein
MTSATVYGTRSRRTTMPTSAASQWQSAPSLTVEGTAFTRNVSRAGSDGNTKGHPLLPFAGVAGPGAIYNVGALSVTACSFSHNQTVGGNDNVSPLLAGLAFGGAIGSGSLVGGPR